MRHRSSCIIVYLVVFSFSLFILSFDEFPVIEPSAPENPVAYHPSGTVQLTVHSDACISSFCADCSSLLPIRLSHFRTSLSLHPFIRTQPDVCTNLLKRHRPGAVHGARSAEQYMIHCPWCFCFFICSPKTGWKAAVRPVILRT